MKNAVILGASGLVGGHLLDLLLNDESVAKVSCYVRTELNRSHEKLDVIVGDLLSDQAFKDIFGDVIFCCVGTTQSKTPDLSTYKKIDVGIPLAAARNGKLNGVTSFLAISSMGASSSSNTFYLKLKGQMENEVTQVGILNTFFIRPSLLLGDRTERRLGERIAAFFMCSLAWLIPLKYKAISGKRVAKAMINIAKSESGVKVFESAELWSLSED